MYDFLRSPIWIFGHLLTLALLVAFVIAGIWQLNRHHERQDKNTATLERAQEPVLSGSELAGLLATSAATESDAAAELEWRIADLNGTWAHGESVLIRNRSLSGLSGCHLAVPLELDGAAGTAQDAAALVIAGWLASATCLEIANADDPTLELTRLATTTLPTTTTNLQGRIRLTQTRGLFGPTDPPTGRLDSLARVDVARINTQTPQALLPAVYVELITATPSPTPPPTGDLQTLAPPSPGAGPHLGYTFQYFAFAAVALIGYPVVIIRHAKPKQNRQTNDL